MPTIKTSKEEVLMKASQLIRQRGYAYTSMSDLAEACAIKPSHFYYYFENKEALMTAILENALQLFREHILIFASDENLTPIEKLDKMLRRMAKAFLYTEGGCLMGNTVLETAYFEPKFVDILRAFFNEFIHALTLVYQAKYTETFARSLAEQVVQDLEGGIMLSLLYREERFMMNAFNRAKAYVSATPFPAV
jgi:TetR/AcrR family transcriptional repressor of nem operon